ncbi:MAG: N-formylglutamate deformylase [Planctomycetota bacterium]
MSNAPYHVRPARGQRTPLLLSIPHTGTEVPAGLGPRLASGTVAALPDTDWHLHELYDFAPELGATTVFSRYTRYAVDLNRPRSRQSLYPGQTETGLVPTETFAGEAIYRAGDEPMAAEIEDRVRRYWQPYHDRLAEELRSLQREFGYALLFDAHSIAGFVPRLHPDPLPDLMLGDVDGTSCDAALSDAVLAVQQRSGYRATRNFRFKGGHITRAYGRPAEAVHALQLEMSQRIYMREAAGAPLDIELAERLRPVLRASLQAFLAAGRALRPG